MAEEAEGSSLAAWERRRHRRPRSPLLADPAGDQARRHRRAVLTPGMGLAILRNNPPRRLRIPLAKALTRPNRDRAMRPAGPNPVPVVYRKACWGLGPRAWVVLRRPAVQGAALQVAGRAHILPNPLKPAWQRWPSRRARRRRCLARASAPRVRLARVRLQRVVATLQATRHTRRARHCTSRKMARR